MREFLLERWCKIGEVSLLRYFKEGRSSYAGERFSCSLAAAQEQHQP